VSLNSTTGVLSGTPAAGSGGSYSITITASNGVSPDASQTFALTVDESPAITSGDSATFTVGTAGSFTITSTGYPAPTFSEIGTLPSGVTLSTAGVLSGTPAAGSGGSYMITITASNGIGTASSQSFTLTVDQAPAITSGDSATFTAGSSGTFTVTATGYPAPTFSESGTLPSGVTLDSTTGVLSGTPIIGSNGTYSIIVTASNGVSPDATQNFTLTVVTSSSAPAITSGDSATFTAGSSGTFTVTATGYPAPTFSESGMLPSGVSLDSPTGVLSGTPAAGSGGSYVITITASNGVSPDASQTFTLTVDEAPAITSGDSATFTVGSSGTFTVTSTGYPAPTFGESGTLPSGVTLDSTTGVLSGTPTTGSGGSYTITITASNGVSPDASQSFTLTVDEAPNITSGDSATFTVGSSGTFTVTSTGYPAPTFGESGTLPSGVTLSTAGVLSGTPAAGTGGSYVITITASNGIGTGASQSFTLTVDQAPSITSADATTFTVGTAGTFTVTATGNPAPTFSETGTLPGGVTLDSTTGVLSGTPIVGSSGTYSITIRATNGVSPDASQSFTLTVPAVGFHISTTSLPNATVGKAYSQQLATEGGGSSIVWKKVSLPKGFALSSTGLLTGTPSSKVIGPQTVDVSASSDKGTPVTASIPLIVDEAPAFGAKSPTSASFDEGTAGSVTVTAVGYPAPTFSETGALPSGVTFDGSTGVLSGTPATTVNGAAYAVTISAENGISPPASETFTLTVYAPLVITTTTLPAATPGAVYAGAQLEATGGGPTPTYSWKKGGTLPKGLTLSSTGELSGTLDSTYTSASSPLSVPVSVTVSEGKVKVTVKATLSLVVT
jgi:uncharacterized cupin superfamily protein